MIEDYERIGVVARTASTTVWKGFDPALKRPVALKQVTRSGAADIVRREAAALARLRHPNVVTVHDVIVDSDSVWLVEQWITGAPLSAVLRHTGPLRAIDALALMHGALSGLACAHDQDLVHADVTPSNILIEQTGTPMLVDFGLATAPGETSAGGTPGYMAPEVAAGGRIDKRSDVYSSCVVLAELLRGENLFPHNQLAAARQQSSVPELGGIERPVAAVMRTGLDPDPAVRPADAKTLLTRLEDAVEETHGRGWLALAGLGTLGSTAATISAGVKLTGTTADAPVASPTPPTGTGRAAAGRGKLIAAAAIGAAILAALVAFLAFRPDPPLPSAAEQSRATIPDAPPPGARPVAAPAEGPVFRGRYRSDAGPEVLTVTSDCARCDATATAPSGTGTLRWTGAGWHGTMSFMCGPYDLTATPTEPVNGVIQALAFQTTSTGCSQAFSGTMTRIGD